MSSVDFPVPEKLIGDKAYDSDRLDEKLAARVHSRNRTARLARILLH
ncbi:hypothetical protein BH20VER2_BH20VER2_04310 [soil metagenome]